MSIPTVKEDSPLPALWAQALNAVRSALREHGYVINRMRGRFVNHVTATATYAVLPQDSTILADATGGSFSINLPAAALSEGRKLTIKKTTAANTVTVDGNASETIDGATTLAMTTQYTAHRLFCDGVQWWLV